MADIDGITRSWVGHLATNPQVREKLLGAQSNVQIANLINETVMPQNRVQPEDVPDIMALAQLMIVQGDVPPPGNFQIVNVIIHPPGG
jgi:hypothetical protein